MTVTGRTLAESVAGRESMDREMITAYDEPLQERAGFRVLSGNLFDFAIIKTSVISDEFRERYLGATKTSSRAALSSSTARTTTTSASTTPTWTSTSPLSW